MKRIILVAALLASSCASSDPADRTIAITMRDNAFSPRTITVDRGETIGFRFTNRGKVAHDAFVGDARAQRMHEGEMDEHGGHGGEGTTVEPGGSATLTHRFTEAGTIEIGCHQPGHYEDGMKLHVTVEG